MEQHKGMHAMTYTEELAVIKDVAKEWMKKHIDYPYPRPEMSKHLLEMIHIKTSNPFIPAGQLTEVMRKLRDTEWPQMVYDAGKVPIIHQQTRTMWARTRTDIRIFYTNMDKSFQVIPREGLKNQAKGAVLDAVNNMKAKLPKSIRSLISGDTDDHDPRRPWRQRQRTETSPMAKKSPTTDESPTTEKLQTEADKSNSSVFSRLRHSLLGQK